MVCKRPFSSRKHELQRGRNRRGVALVESAVTLAFTLLLLFAILDLGIAATRYNALAEVSRRIAREAILHGATAPPETGRWGPSEYRGALADGSDIAAAAAGMFPTMKAEDVAVRVTWLDGNNTSRSRVQVEASYLHSPFVPALCPWGPLKLRSVTTMRVVN